MIANKEAILQQSKQQELQEMAAGGDKRPKSIVGASSYDPRTLNYDRTIAAFTKVCAVWISCSAVTDSL